MVRRLLKFGKRIFVFLFIIIISLNIFILLSGRFYLYKGVWNTYLQGKTSPTIYDKDIFYSSQLAAQGKRYWKEPNNLQMCSAPELEKYANRYKTASFLIIKNSEIVYEKYWDNHQIHTVSNSFSAAKTVVSLLIGIAMEEGKIKSLDEKVSHYLKEFKGNGKENITIRHLLTMSSGLDWEESAKNPLSENAESYYGSDLWGLVHRQKLVDKPGTKFNYQSGNTQLLGYVVEKATGTDLTSYAKDKIWKKIGAESDAWWSLDKENGDEKSFCCLYATTRDFARIGQLFNNKGKWGDIQIVPEKYIESMAFNQKMATKENVPNTRYGLHVWTYKFRGKQVIYCRGIKGQYIIAVPEDNVVIVRTGNDRASNIQAKEFKGKLSKFQEAKLDHPRDLMNYLNLSYDYLKKLNR